jgi:hypothetical protein
VVEIYDSSEEPKNDIFLYRLSKIWISMNHLKIKLLIFHGSPPPTVISSYICTSSAALSSYIITSQLNRRWLQQYTKNNFKLYQFSCLLNQTALCNVTITFPRQTTTHMCVNFRMIVTYLGFNLSYFCNDYLCKI